MAREKVQDFSGAIEDYDKALELDQNDPATVAVYHENRGLAKVAINDLSGAVYDFTKALELNPEDAFMFYCRGVARAKLSNSDGCSDIYKAKEISDKGNLVYSLEDRLAEAMQRFCK